MNNLILIYITTPSQETAAEIAQHLLEKKLIACANIFPVVGMYWWEEKIGQTTEAALICKTMPEKYEAVKEATKLVHAYETPCIVKIEAEANKSYFDFVQDVVKGK